MAGEQLVWTGGNRIVFPWEGDGWTHLYSIASDGGTPILLTPGEFEVEHVAYSEDGGEIAYSSNQDDIDRRHIWRVAASGGTPVAMTAGAGLEWSPAATSNGQLVFIHSDTRRQARPAIRLASGEARDLAEEIVLDKKRKHEIAVTVDRLVVREKLRRRLLLVFLHMPNVEPPASGRTGSPGL